MDKFCETFETAIPELRTKISEAFKAHQSNAGYRSLWEHFENIINPILTEFLMATPLFIPSTDIIIAQSKSVYPDLKVIFEKKQYAIDIKSGETGINPWYDIGRIDTYEKKHLDKYIAEYCITVRWSGRKNSQVDDVYIEPTFKSVGYRLESNGVLYRPYDGKLRPKSWLDFESGKNHWQNLNHFKKGLVASQEYRWLSFIVLWYQDMNSSRRELLKEYLKRIDDGETITLDPISDTDGQNRD